MDETQRRIERLEREVAMLHEQLSYLLDARNDAPDKTTGFGELDFEHGSQLPRYGSDELD